MGTKKIERDVFESLKGIAWLVWLKKFIAAFTLGFIIFREIITPTINPISALNHEQPFAVIKKAAYNSQKSKFLNINNFMANLFAKQIQRNY